MHEFYWWSLGRNAVGQANDVKRKAVEGSWLIIDHAYRLKFQSRLVVNGDWCNYNRSGWWPLQHLPPGYYSNAVLGFLANDDGAGRLLGTSSMNPRGRIVGAFSLSARQWWEWRGSAGTRYSCSGESPVLGLELHLLFLGIAPCGSKLRRVLCFLFKLFIFFWKYINLFIVLL